MRINQTQAAALLREEAGRAGQQPIDNEWERKVEQLSQLCEQGVSKTHIAFLGTVLLAKAMDLNADLFAIKPEHSPDNPNAFSARSLCHSVLVPLSAELGFSLGVTGREPLNNQPYFRMTSLRDGTPVHQGARAAFDFMVSLVSELQSISNQEQAKNALRAFIAVRRRYQPRYAEHAEREGISPDRLPFIIQNLVLNDSEGGRRAQAVVAGLLDVFAGPGRVESGRINDPSRHYPGDVCVKFAPDSIELEKSFEVRDKPVKASDVQIFGNKCISMGVREAALVMVSNRQQELDNRGLAGWADERGLGLTLFYGWESFVEQVLFWASKPKHVGASEAVHFISQRLIAVEASPEALALWAELVDGQLA